MTDKPFIINRQSNQAWRTTLAEFQAISPDKAFSGRHAEITDLARLHNRANNQTKAEEEQNESKNPWKWTAL